MRSTHKANRPNPSSASSSNPSDAIFDHNAVRYVYAHSFRGVQEKVGMWFSPLDQCRLKYMRIKKLEKPSFDQSKSQFRWV